MFRTAAGRITIVPAAFLVAMLIARSAGADPILVSPGAAAAAMVANLIKPGSGITVVPGSETYVGAPLASGLFTGGTGILPFDGGVALTTGLESIIPGPNNNPSAGFSNGKPPDAGLDAVARAVLHLGPGVNLHSGDAAILQFQFTSTSPTVSFQYVFGSEEYNEFVGTRFNDVFAFFLNGTNIALLPNGDPITVNTVNSGSDSEYYLDNTAGTLNIQYDGLVGDNLALFATGSVSTTGVNTIRLGIEDVGDLLLDSGVMLKANSFQGGPPPGPAVPESNTLTLMASALGVALAPRFTRRWRALPCRGRNSSCTPRPGVWA